jgi:hypothetical protein
MFDLFVSAFFYDFDADVIYLGPGLNRQALGRFLCSTIAAFNRDNFQPHRGDQHSFLTQSPNQGCQIFLSTKYQSGEKIKLRTTK